MLIWFSLVNIYWSLIYVRFGLGFGDIDELDIVFILMGVVESLVGKIDIKGGNFSWMC